WSLQDLEQLFTQIWAYSEWREPLVLLCGLLQEGRPEHVIAVLKAAISTVTVDWTGFPPSLLALLVVCLAEVSSLQSGVAHDFALAINDLIWANSRLLYFTIGGDFWHAPVPAAYQAAGEHWPG